MSAAVDTERTRYRFGPLEQRGLIAGWRGGQIVAVACGLVIAVFALRADPSAGGVVVGLGATALGVAVACWPVNGRTAEQWLPLVARWSMATVSGGQRRTSELPVAGHHVVVDSNHPGTTVGTIRPALGRRLKVGSPTVFDHLRLVSLPLDEEGGPSIGAVMDERGRTATAVMAVRGHSFALLGPTDQDHRIGAWSRVLATLAREGSVVHRLQWIESCLPDHGDAVRSHLARHAVLGPETDAVRSYGSLIDESSPTTRRHQVLIALSVHTRRSPKSSRSSGGDDGSVSAVLAREIVSVQRQLEAAEINVQGVLGPSALGACFRHALSSLSQLEHSRTADDGREAVMAEVAPWPMTIEAQWDSLRTDATWHATYWIAEWPRVDVTPDFLGPLFFSPVRRTLSVTMEPVSPSKAARQVAQARTADLADNELRKRGGFLVTARQLREKQGVEHRDVELADGHAQYRFSGYLTVTADSVEELRHGCRSIEQAAGQARLELRRLYGEQDIALTAVLPLGRGLS